MSMPALWDESPERRAGAEDMILYPGVELVRDPTRAILWPIDVTERRVRLLLALLGLGIVFAVGVAAFGIGAWAVLARQGGDL